jgi:hypothetical protein
VKTVGVRLEPTYKEMREDGEKKIENDMWAVVGVGLAMHNCRTVDPNWAPKEPVLLAAPIRTILTDENDRGYPCRFSFPVLGIDQGDQQSVNLNET